MITNFDILSDDEMDADFEQAHTFQFKKVKEETREEKYKRLEIQRVIEIRKILTGGFKYGSVIENRLVFLIGHDLYNDAPGLIEDCVIDRYGNTALHYAIAPDCAGDITVEQITTLAISLVLETVLSCNINPHILNHKGLTALNYVKDFEILDMLEDRTKTFRPDVYCPIHFAAARKQLKIRGV